MSEDSNKLDVYKELHYNEISRKTTIDERMKWLLSMWIVLLGTIVFCFQNYYKVHISFINVFAILIAYAIVALFVCGFLLGKCFSKKNYAHIPSPNKIEVYLSAVPEEKFESYMIELFSNAYDVNFATNNKLVKTLVDCTHLMMFSVLLIFVSFLCFAPEWIEKDEPVQKIEIIKGGE